MSIPIRRLAALTGTAALLALPTARLAAQDTPAGVTPSRFTAEVYLAQYALNGSAIPGSSQNDLGGFGGRLMFNHSTAARGLRTFFDRASAGVFATYTAGQGSTNVTTLNYGIEGDAALFPVPIANGYLDPFISLGAGGFRRSTAITGSNDRRTSTDLAITPALGTRIPLFSGLAIRGDLRLPIIFGDNTSMSFVAEGGMSLSF